MQLPTRGQSCACEEAWLRPCPKDRHLSLTLAGQRFPASQGLSSLASRRRSLTLRASGHVLEGQREQSAAGKVVGRGRDLREAGSSGGGDKVLGKRGRKGAESPDTDGAGSWRGLPREQPGDSDSPATGSQEQTSAWGPKVSRLTGTGGKPSAVKAGDLRRGSTRAGQLLTRGCRGSQVGSESQSHVSRGTSTSPRKMLRPRLSRCHTDRLSTRPRSSACGTEYWGQEVCFNEAASMAPASVLRECWLGLILPRSLLEGILGNPGRY